MRGRDRALLQRRGDPVDRQAEALGPGRPAKAVGQMQRRGVVDLRQLAHELPRGPVDLQRAGLRQPQRPARRAARHAQIAVRLLDRDVGLRRQPGYGDVGRGRGEHQATAARLDGRQQGARTAGDQQQHAAFGRLLQRLQHGVGGAGTKVVGGVDDGDAVSRSAG
jgi:hypothetical protein